MSRGAMETQRKMDKIAASRDGRSQDRGFKASKQRVKTWNLRHQKVNEGRLEPIP